MNLGYSYPVLTKVLLPWLHLVFELQDQLSTAGREDTLHLDWTPSIHWYPA